MLEDEVTMFEGLDLIEKIHQDGVRQLLKIFEEEEEGGEPKNVAEGQEVWEEATSMAKVAAISMTTATSTTMVAMTETSMPETSIEIARAAYGMTFIVPVETKLTTEDCESAASGAWNHEIWKP